MALTSEELNFLVYRYLQESGKHAAEVADVRERDDERQNALFVFTFPCCRKNGDAARRFWFDGIQSYGGPFGSRVMPLLIIPRSLMDRVTFALSI